jgi:hypothetical protein
MMSGSWRCAVSRNLRASARPDIFGSIQSISTTSGKPH